MSSSGACVRGIPECYSDSVDSDTAFAVTLIVVIRDAALLERLRTFGDRVRSRRHALGLSQEALADQAGLHRTYIGSVERGERNVSLGNAYALADVLGLPLPDLLAPS